jgi:predicted PhzF superfamily epimerase YddE/YHI9
MVRVGELHQLRVFAGAEALGNVTGVVAVAGQADKKWMAGVSARLGYPDTAFVHLPGVTRRRFGVDSFSPFEELRICTQTLLAARSVLAAAGLIDDADEVTADVAAGPVLMRRVAQEPGITYVLLPGGEAGARSASAPLPPSLGPAGDSLRPLVVSAGRDRLYCTVPAGRLDAVELSPQAVLAYCRAERVRGICLTSGGADGSGARLRVFTTSLGGAEDVSTGGAAIGLVRYWESAGTPLPAGSACWVGQGCGGPQRKAELRVRHFDDGAVGVGGRVEPTAVGRLL